MGSVAFVFAGQGAQYPGMGKDLYETSDAARKVFDRAEEIRPGTLDMCFCGAQEELSQTVNTQPCLFAMDYACAMAAMEAGAKADRCAGFSLGETVAAAFAGMMDFDAAFRFVMLRAEAMQACAHKNTGAMGAVMRITANQVEEICREMDGRAYPVNYNCPGQTVVACLADSFDELSRKVAAAKGRVIRLNVSGAFHSPWMADASKVLAEYLSGMKLNAPDMAVYANTTAMPYEGDYAQLLSEQVSSPVRWQNTVENMAAAGVDTFIEMGAGKTLSGLIKKTVSGVKVLNVEKAADIAALREAMCL